ncbi:uncharacterized protein LOC113862243 [Abrus precatorius]|uniref:Uncharacterized protein LOC113862243 n=1 Tax=Abrus precatorius TaxID=3816 RepID=A0A8B8L6Y8_ABRPR|nr:uncharacterized protein LOC113862243 [Abrus precatorius]
MGHLANNCWLAPQRSGSASGSNTPISRASSGAKPNVQGKVFTMNGSEASKSNELIRDKCIINNRLCDVLFDSSATHSFVSMDCVNCVGLPISSLACNVIVSTPTAKPMATSYVCLDCKEKALIFGDDTPGNSRLLSMGETRNTVETKAFMVLFSAEIDKTVKAEYISVVQDFLEVFLEVVIELPPERDFKFTINLILGASPVSITPYRMLPVELAKVYNVHVSTPTDFGHACIGHLLPAVGLSFDALPRPPR